MLLSVYLVAVSVLLMIDLLPLLRGDAAADGAFVVDFPIHVSLASVGPGRFSSSLMPGAEALRGAILLVGFTVVDCVGLDRLVVVFEKA